MHEDFKTHMSKAASSVVEAQAAPASTHALLPTVVPLQLLSLEQAKEAGQAAAAAEISELQAALTQEMHVESADVGFWQVKPELEAELELEHPAARLTVRQNDGSAAERMPSNFIGARLTWPHASRSPFGPTASVLRSHRGDLRGLQRLPPVRCLVRHCLA
jgi:hypothetical protein